MVYIFEKLIFDNLIIPDEIIFAACFRFTIYS